LVVVGGEQVSEMLPLGVVVVVVVGTWRLVVMVMVRMIHMMSQFLGLILDPGRT